jgi:hypothetical protein
MKKRFADVFHVVMMSVGLKVVLAAEIEGRVVYLDLARVFLLLRLRRRTRFFLHLALILSA